MLRDIGARRITLRGIIGIDGRTVLAAMVRPLPVELGRIVHHREEHLQQLPVADLRRVIADLHSLGVTTAATAATTAFNVALKSNGFGAIISLILSAVAALGTWLLLTDSDTEATKANTKARSLDWALVLLEC